jgi:hypothetical protein
VLGIAPFDDINNTKLLLANIHLLDLKLSDKLFNEKAVMAIKNMFKENFHQLYDLKVANIAGNNVGHLPESKITLFMTKIIENKELKLDDIFEAFGPTENQIEQAVIQEDLQPRIIINQDFTLNPPINLIQPINLNPGFTINFNQGFTLNQPIILNPGFTINLTPGFTLNPPIILNQELTLNEEITPNEELILDTQILSQEISPNEEVILNHNEPIINQEENFEERLNRFKEMAPKLLSLYKAIDPKILEYSYNIMQFINQFYMNGHDRGFGMLATQLAFCFGKTEDIDNFLEKEVNFESFQTLENTIALIGPEFFEASEVSLPEIKIWREINGKYGKEAIKLFAKAGDLKSAGFDIYEFAQTNAIEDVYKKAQELSKTLKYKDEESHKELAKLMHEYNYSEKIFNKVVKEILPNQKKDDLIPNISFKMKLPQKGEFTFSKLKPGALEGLFLGKKSYSCQSIDYDGEQCAIDGFTRQDAGFYVFKNKKGEIIAQSYAWIGQNKNGEDVLVLDSYEYVPLPAYKDLFVMAMKKLEVEIKKFGFSELYVGCGGRTPKLNSEQLHEEVKPKDKGLFQYYDSKSVYKITQDICLKEDNDSDILIEYKDFTEFSDKNLVLNWDKIIGENHDSEKSLVNTHDNVIHNLRNSKLLKDLIQKQIIPFEMIASISEECFAILPDTHPLSLKIRVELIEEILIVANKNIEDAFKLINKCSQIHPSLAQEMNLKELIEFCGMFEHSLPIIISNAAQLNGIDKEVQESALKAVFLGLKKFEGKSEVIVNLLNNLSNINSQLIKNLSLEELFIFCNLPYLPMVISRHAQINGFDNETQEIALKVLLLGVEKFGVESEKIVNLLNNLSNINSQLIKNLPLEDLFMLCSNLQHIPNIISRYAQINGFDNETQEIALKVLLLGLEKFGVESEKIVNLLNNLSNIKKEFIKTFSLETLLEVCAKFDYVPLCFSSYSKLEVGFVSEVFSLIMNKYVGEYQMISPILSKIGLIHPQLIKIMDSQKLIELCSKLEYVPSVMGSLDSEVVLNLVLCAFEENKNDIQKFVKTCSNLNSVNPLLLDLLEPQILVEFCSNVGNMPFGMVNSNENIININEKYKDFISCTFNKYKDNSTLIYKVLDSLFQLHQEVFNEVDNVKLIEVLAKSDYMPYVLSKYTEINEIKRLDLVKELFKFSSDIIVKICNTKLGCNFDNQEVNQIHIYAEEFEKETLGEYIFEENDN